MITGMFHQAPASNPPAEQTIPISIETQATTTSQTTNALPTLPVVPTPTDAGERQQVYFSGDPTSYFKDAKYVYYSGQYIPGSDATTFVLLASANGYSGYARDASHVYWYGQVITGADPATFKFPWTYNLSFDAYARDKSHVFKNGSTLADADPQTFIVLAGYAKDKRFVYCDGEKISNADPAVFKSIFAQYPKDNSAYKVKYGADAVHVYSGCAPLVGADPKTFEILTFTGGEPSGYSKDVANVYYRDKVIKGADAPSFVMGGAGYQAHDNNHAYSYGVPYISNYVTDKNGNDSAFSVEHGRVFYGGVVELSGADPESFVVLSDVNGDGTMFAKDSHNVYFQNKTFLNADPSSFTLFFYPNGTLSGYAKDRARVYFNFSRFGGTYYEPGLVDGANAASFTTNIKTVYSIGFGKDASAVYFMGKKLSADPINFMQFEVKDIPLRYFKDSSFVYYLIYDGQDKHAIPVVSGAQQQSFTLLMDISGNTTNYAKDADTVFYSGNATSSVPISLVSADAASFQVVSPPEGCIPNPEGNCFIDARDSRSGYFKGVKVN